MAVKKILLTKKSDLLFIGLLVLMFFVYRYPHSIRKGPYSIHMWRQADCCSFTLNYAREGMQFFQPGIHATAIHTDGKTVSEFPVIYYLVAALWKLFGEHHWIFRAVNLLTVYLGMFYLFRLGKELLSSDFWAMLVPLILFTSPSLVYYSNNFLMNAPAFGLVLIAFYQYWRYMNTRAKSRLYLAMGIFLLAGLLKTTALLLFVALLMVHLLGLSKIARYRFGLPDTYRSDGLIPFVLVILAFSGWFIWTAGYNRAHTSGVFLRGLLPIWETGLYDGLYLGTRLYNHLQPAWFHRSAMVLLGGLYLWLILNRGISDPVFRLITSLCIAGALVFILLFFQAFTVHDYYLINLLICIPLVSLCFLRHLREKKPGLLENRAFRGIVLAGMLLMVYSTMVIQRAKFDTGDTFVKHGITLDSEEKKLYRYLQDDYANRFRALETIRPVLKELGITRDEPVVSIPDASPNISLYLMDRKGATDYGEGYLRGRERMRVFVERGARYLLVNDPSILEQEYLQPFLANPVGKHHNVKIFRLDATMALVP